MTGSCIRCGKTGGGVVLLQMEQWGTKFKHLKDGQQIDLACYIDLCAEKAMGFWFGVIIAGVALGAGAFVGVVLLAIEGK